MTTDPTVILVHIPKTAGLTFLRIVARHFAPEETYYLAQDYDNNLAAYKRMPEAGRALYRLIMGHMDFGLHEWAPGPATYLTMLREPIDRLLSLYWFTYYVDTMPLHRLIHDNNLSAAEFVQSRKEPLVRNAQVRVLSGVWHQLGEKECTREHLELAKRHLREHFSVIGLTERFDETLLLLRHTFGWRKLSYVPLNVNRQRPARATLPAASMESVIEANQLDLALYAFAQELFEEQVRRCGPAFAEELRRFQQLNRLRAPFYDAYWGIRRRSLRVYLRRQWARLQASRPNVT